MRLYLLLLLLGSQFICSFLSADGNENPPSQESTMNEKNDSKEEGKNKDEEKGEDKEGKEGKDNDFDEGKDKDKDDKEEKKSDKKDSPHTVTSVVTFLTDYRSRGISQTMRRPAVQGEIKYTHESGFYFKSWASNVDGTSNFITNTSTEWNFFVGFEHAFCRSDLHYDFGCIIYYYPGGKALQPPGVRYNTVEYYIGFSYKGFDMKFYQTINDYYGVNSDNPPFNWRTFSFSRPNGHSYGSPYIEANYEWELCPKWKAGLHLGYQAIIHYSELNYLDWQVSVIREFEEFNVALYYLSTNARHSFYDVPDRAAHPSIRKLGGPGLIGAIYKEF